MPRHLFVLLLASALGACSNGNLCSLAPRCDDGIALNCDTACVVGPCSTGPTELECAEGTTCTVVPGDSNDARFFRSRAVCAQELSACDPATAAPPVCDGRGFVSGCSAYRRNIHVTCAQAGVYFRDAACCRGSIPDAGAPDAGADDGGIPDAGGLDEDGGS
ncbi:hypothetical protein KRR26_26905 [Corallococcus sp. M34]|uniref:hypothetical protein n=1 Tax=Citreicoccus inhibens TaxID=2849499 RepID=UPI0018F407AF|nr:hypothetical protein [Citreicoccus inhibens]MBU8899251.1 hypothetical protein [Citreicoccus inhibens]